MKGMLNMEKLLALILLLLPVAADAQLIGNQGAYRAYTDAAISALGLTDGTGELDVKSVTTDDIIVNPSTAGGNPWKIPNHAYTQTVNRDDVAGLLYMKDHMWHRAVRYWSDDITSPDKTITDAFGNAIVRLDAIDFASSLTRWSGAEPYYVTPLAYYQLLGMSGSGDLFDSVTEASETSPLPALFPYAPIPYVAVGDDEVIALSTVPYPSGYYRPRDFVETFARGLDAPVDVTDASNPLTYGDYYPDGTGQDTWRYMTSYLVDLTTKTITDADALHFVSGAQGACGAIVYGTAAASPPAVPFFSQSVFTGVDKSKPLTLTVRLKTTINANLADDVNGGIWITICDAKDEPSDYLTLRLGRGADGYELKRRYISNGGSVQSATLTTVPVADTYATYFVSLNPDGTFSAGIDGGETVTGTMRAVASWDNIGIGISQIPGVYAGKTIDTTIDWIRVTN